MANNDDKYSKLLSQYSDIQKKNKSIVISDEKKKEITELIDSGELFREIGLINNHDSINNSSKKKPSKLSFVYNIESLTINPRESVQYTKETQTVKNNIQVNTNQVESPALGRVVSPKFLTALEWDDEFEGRLFSNPESIPMDLSIMVESVSKRKGQMTEEDKLEILKTDGFLEFFDRACDVIETALETRQVDIFTDYAGAPDDDDDDQYNARRRKHILEPGRILSNSTSEKWTRQRIVTGLDWSPFFSEQLLASYIAPQDYHSVASSDGLVGGVTNQPDGLCLVWNTKAQEHQVLHYKSPITTASFAKDHPSLVIGGTYSGQIVLWDIRSSKRTPVQRTVLSASSHTHPIVGIQSLVLTSSFYGGTGSSLVDSSSNSTLVSVSSDGKMCCWQLEMMSQPLDTIQLANNRSKEINCTCLDLLPACTLVNDEGLVQYSSSSQFIVGAEDGLVYIGERGASSRPGECTSLDGGSHNGPVMSISVRAHNMPDAALMHDSEMGNDGTLCLTSSVDYSVKLWSCTPSPSGNGETTPQLVTSLADRSDYVYDVDWSRCNNSTPCSQMFCCVDGAGVIELWHLQSTLEEPLAKQSICNWSGQNALSRCRWHSANPIIATGDDVGQVRLHLINEASCSALL